jgi:4-amino-4-deoxy-L-arabinose transferase-like glycosyltransferase
MTPAAAPATDWFRAIRQNSALAGIVLWGLALRLGCFAFVPSDIRDNPDALVYREVGARFWSTFEITGLHFHTPLYPIITGLLGPTWTAMFDIGVSTVTIIWVYVLAAQVCRNKLIALFASFFAASNPLFVFYSVTGLSETLYMALTVMAFVCWYVRRFFVAAIVSVLAVLTRPLFDVIAPIMILCFSFVVFRQPLRAALRHLLAYAAVYCVLMAPWWINNVRVYGEFVRLVPLSAAVFYIGNNPMNDTGAETPDVDFVRSRIHVPSSAVLATNAELKSEAIAFIEEHPAKFVELAIKKAFILWRPWPIAGPYSVGIFYWINLLTAAPLILFAAIGAGLLARKDARRASPIFMHLFIYTAIIMVLASATRYRIPLEPFLCVLAAIPVAMLVRSTRSGEAGLAAGLPGN